MLSRPKSAQPKAQGSSRLKQILFGFTLIFALCCYVLFFDFHNTNAQALSGELTLNGEQQAQAVPQGSGFIAFLFDYWGSFSYILPLIIVYLGAELFLFRISLKNIDFFRLGLRILGFNTFCLGACALFSALGSRGVSGAGGILGDFLNLIIAALLPSSLGTLTALIFTLVGLFLFIGKSPLQLCESVGAGFFGVLERLKGRGAKAPRETAAPAVATTATSSSFNGAGTDGQAETKIAAGSSIIGETSDDGAAYFGARTAAMESSQIAPALEETKASSTFVRQEDAADSTLSAGAAGGSEHFASSAFGSGKQNRADPFFGSDSQSRRVRVEPGFGDEGNFAAADPYPAEAYPAYTTASTAFSVASEEAQADDRVSTIITRAGESTTVTGEAAAEGAGVSTIITTAQPSPQAPDLKAGAGSLSSAIAGPAAPSAAEDDGETHTVITYHQPTTAVPNEQTAAASASDEEEIHTHIFRNGAVAGSVAEVTAAGRVQEGNKSSTAQQTGQSASLSGVQLNSELNSDTPVVSASGMSYTQRPDDSLADSYGPAEVKDKNEPSGHSEGRIISFNDFLSKEERQGQPSFELNSLPPAVAAASADKKAALSDEKEHISEKDLAERYPSASRGVLNSTAPETGGSVAAGTASVEKTVLSPEPKVGAAVPEVSGIGHAGSPLTASPAAAVPEQAQSISPLVSQGSNSNTSNLPAYLQNTNNGNTAENSDGQIFSVPTKTDCVPSSISAPSTFYDAWRPGADLLTPSPDTEQVDECIFAEMAQRINSFFADFKIKAQVVGHRDGPVITTYALELAPGVRFASIHNLVDDLCRILKVPPHSVRALSSLPGTIFAGLEVPSPKRRLISLHDVAASPEFQNTRAELPLCLGQNVEGKPVIVDLATAPHLLIAGTTGSGKSAGLNSMLISLLLKRSPAELRLILIDPKRLEFALYNNLPHLITPVISDVAEKTGAALQWCIDEMERRYRLFESFSVRKLNEYNEIIEQAQLNGELVTDPVWSPEMGGTPPVLRKLPYIVVVIEEFADLMAQLNGRRGKGADTPEAAIARLAAKSRACGIHIILATQTPRAEIITGTIRANMPSRVAFTVQSGRESLIVLDETGAECLLGLGDMICKFNGFNRNASFRAHGAFVSNSDVLRVVESWQSHGEPEYIDGVTELPEDEQEESSAENEGSSGQRLDPYFERVKEYALDYYARRQKPLPTSEIQSVFQVGYPRARKIAYQLEREGVLDNN